MRRHSKRSQRQSVRKVSRKQFRVVGRTSDVRRCDHVVGRGTLGVGPSMKSVRTKRQIVCPRKRKVQQVIHSVGGRLQRVRGHVHAVAAPCSRGGLERAVGRQVRAICVGREDGACVRRSSLCTSPHQSVADSPHRVRVSSSEHGGLRASRARCQGMVCGRAMAPCGSRCRGCAAARRTLPSSSMRCRCAATAC